MKTVQNIMDELETYGEEERKTVLGKLIPMLCPASTETLMSFQNEWDEAKGYAAFIEKQNEVFKVCLVLETNEIGVIARKAYKLDPMTRDTIVVK